MAKDKDDRSNTVILLDVKVEMERTMRKVTEALLEPTNVGYNDIYIRTQSLLRQRGQRWTSRKN